MNQDCACLAAPVQAVSVLRPTSKVSRVLVGVVHSILAFPSLLLVTHHSSFFCQCVLGMYILPGITSFLFRSTWFADEFGSLAHCSRYEFLHAEAQPQGLLCRVCRHLGRSRSCQPPYIADSIPEPCVRDAGNGSRGVLTYCTVQEASRDRSVTTKALPLMLS